MKWILIALLGFTLIGCHMETGNYVFPSGARVYYKHTNTNGFIVYADHIYEDENGEETHITSLSIRTGDDTKVVQTPTGLKAPGKRTTGFYILWSPTFKVGFDSRLDR